jgi:hypothetical protein
MTGRWERRAVPLAWGIGLGSLVLLLACLVLLALDWKAIDSLGTAQAGYFLQVPIVGILGVLIAARRPRNPIGRLLLAISAISAIYLTADLLAMRGLLSGVSARGWVSAAAWLYNNTGTLGALLLGFVALFFPTGRLLPGRRWRWAAWALVVGVATGTVSSMLALVPIALSPRLPVVPNPLGVPALNGVTNSSGLNNAPCSCSSFSSWSRWWCASAGRGTWSEASSVGSRTRPQWRWHSSSPGLSCPVRAPAAPVTWRGPLGAWCSSCWSRQRSGSLS